MEVLALRSPGLAASKIQEAAAAAGITVTVVTSLNEANERGLAMAVVIVDGVGETADILAALREHKQQVERVIWIGFEAPGIDLPGLTVVSPIDGEQVLIAALSGGGQPAAAVDETLVPISLMPTQAPAGAASGWNLEVQQPKAPLDRPIPKVLEVDVSFDEEDFARVTPTEDADFVARPQLPMISWRKWLRSAAPVALVLVGLGVMSLAQARQRAVTREADCSEPPHRVAELSPRRSFAVGLVHGASGTAALTLLVATTLSDPLDALGYILTFSASSVVAMPLAAATLFWLARATLGSAPGRLVIFQRLAGVVSIVAGALIALAALPFSGMS